MSDRAQRVAEIVKSALERNPEERSTFLDQACPADSETRAEVDSFLQFEDEASHFIEQGALHVAAKTIARDSSSPFPQQIDGYQILSRIGVGGMGEVYLAEETKLRRKVALKLVRAGMDSAEIVARFRHEEQILASLNHPNIAQLYGAGVAAGDIPFFAMEHVAGTRIDEYCSAHKLSASARLQLFQKVCAAVHYAHQRLVIHRDLKPSNILVTSDGEPKLLDFGIAKLVEGQDGFTQMQTLPGAMTPDYASPEQIRGDAVTTSSDIYSLGVLLYELLTGQRPYRLKTRSADEIARAITEQEPERPSTVLARAENSTFEIRHSKFPKGDLDNIVLMALRKEPQRRYASVGQFSEDIRRYLEGLPVVAHKDTVSYRATKFVKRHKIGMAAALLVLLTLVGGIIATAWQAKRATEQARVAAQERDRARKEAAKSEHINSFLKNVLGFSDPSWLSSNPRRNREPTIAEALEEASRRAEKELADEPEVLASVRFVIGQTYLSQRRLEAAELHLRAAYDLRRNVLGPESQETANSMATLAELRLWQGKYAEAELLFRDALATFRHAREAGNVNVLWMTYALTIAGGTEITMGRAAAGEATLREALEVGHLLSGADRVPLGVIYSSLSVARSDQGDVDGAISYLEKSLDEQRRISNEPGFEIAMGLNNLGNLLALKGDYGRAESLLRESIEILAKSVGEAHQNTAYAVINLANVYCLRCDYPQAREEIDRAMRIQQQVLAEGHIDFARSWIVLGRILTRTGEPNVGESYLRRALELRTQALKPGHWRIAETQGALGECFMTQHRLDEAEPLLLESHKVMQEKFGAKDPRTKEARNRLVALYEAWGKPEVAAGYRPE
jgi:serine/threonine-protein kinase